MEEQVSAEQVLAARDRRARRQRELLEAHGLPLVSFSMNIPGPVKNGPLIRRAFRLGAQMLRERLALEHAEVLFAEELDDVAGCEGLYVTDLDPLRLKALTVAIEENTPAGRLYDMDVLAPDGTKLGRAVPRKCLLCGEPAFICRRSLAHSTEQLRSAAEQILREYLDRYDAIS